VPSSMRSDGSSAPSGIRPVAARPRVLVLDDDRGVRASIRRLLGSSYETVEATSVAEAFGLVEQGLHFDAVLLDLVLPDAGGMTFVRLFQEIEPTCTERIAFVTGGPPSPSAAAFLRETPRPVLHKPFSGAQLRALVHGIVHQTSGTTDATDSSATNAIHESVPELATDRRVVAR
jgi:CheY-like chemotaxis protein